MQPGTSVLPSSHMLIYPHRHIHRHADWARAVQRHCGCWRGAYVQCAGRCRLCGRCRADNTCCVACPLLCLFIRELRRSMISMY
jgi:hypothetical protein